MTPPEGSNVTLERRQNHDKIVMPHSDGGVIRYFFAAFIIFWLCGWATSWIITAIKIFKSGGTNMFLIFLLAAWTTGGILAFFFLTRTLRRSAPENLLAYPTSLVHDPGVLPMTISFYSRSHMQAWNTIFKRRKTVEFSHKEIQTLKLRDIDGGNRLTIDKGRNRFDLAIPLSEIEREWLYYTLVEKYSITQESIPNP